MAILVILFSKAIRSISKSNLFRAYFWSLDFSYRCSHKLEKIRYYTITIQIFLKRFLKFMNSFIIRFTKRFMGFCRFSVLLAYPKNKFSGLCCAYKRLCIDLCLHLYKNLISELHDSIFRNGMSEMVFFNFLKNPSNKLASFYVSFQGTNTYFLD